MKDNESDGGEAITREPSDYDLKIDRQVEKFLELKHKVVFFLMTAAIGSIGYTLNFSIGKLNEVVARGERMVCLIVGSLAGLLVVGCALISLSYEIKSYRVHLETRYNRTSYQQLSKEKKREWDKINKTARNFQRAAFVLLFVSVASQAGLFMLFLF